MRFAALIGLALSAVALGQNTIDVNSELDAIKRDVADASFGSAMGRGTRLTQFAAEAARSAGPSGEYVSPLKFTAGTGDVSYISAMVEHTRLAFQANDVQRFLHYSADLGAALGQEYTHQNEVGVSNGQLTGIPRYSALPKLAKTAVDRGDLARAYAFANELIDSAAKNPKWPQGNAIHDGNMVLGRLALRAGDVAGAKKFLLAAGLSEGSPVLGSFGPNMTLARELLAAGERDAVLEYFSECAHFWKMGTEKLPMWTAAVKNGKIPDFGANLVY